jgi:NAD(P)-dependent dehydrogenase (short-subunit alcohol dehydrogenase family)
MSKRYEGQIVAISGASGGIGSVTARAFHHQGAKLILIDRDASELATLANELDAQMVVCDQTQDNQIEIAAREIGVVDIFVNNAGIILRKPLFEHSYAEIDRVFAINLSGAIKLAVGLARPMRKSAGGRGGVIINVSTQHAFAGGGGRAIYAASKAALAQFTKSAAVEWIGEGIRVCGIAPGPAVSPMTEAARQSPDYVRQVVERMPVGRFLEVEEIAHAIIALADPNMSAIVGATLLADGGGTLS